MGDDHPNALAYLRTVDAFRDRDFEMIASLIAEDVVWHLPGDHPLAGDWEGRDRLFELLAKLGPLGFTIREHDVFADDDHVCALSYIGARREDLEVETRVVSIFHYRDGRQTERWFYPDDFVAWNSIFGGEWRGRASSTVLRRRARGRCDAARPAWCTGRCAGCGWTAVRGQCSGCPRGW